jgi:PPK2 family polyphosphate:nucleotide phosphotransferase
VPKRTGLDASAFERRYRVARPKSFRLADVDCGDTFDLGRRDADRLREAGAERLADLQERLHAQDLWAVLLVFQAMDAAGKDSTIHHVLSGLMPQAFQVWSFKAPSEEELDHDWLWRGLVRLPERGRIGVHNRSWYEETLVVRVHPEILRRQRIPPRLVGRGLWKERYESINDAERHLARNGTVVRKFFLHVSKEEQRRRFLKRLEDPEKRWKFSPADVRERARWDAYMRAYEETIRSTSTPHAPWYVVPADHKWFLHLAVTAVVVDALQGLGLSYPKFGRTRDAEVREARALLRRKG